MTLLNGTTGSGVENFMEILSFRIGDCACFFLYKTSHFHSLDLRVWIRMLGARPLSFLDFPFTMAPGRMGQKARILEYAKGTRRVKLLLDKKGVDPDSKDIKYGRTPLSWARTRRAWRINPF